MPVFAQHGKSQPTRETPDICTERGDRMWDVLVSDATVRNERQECLQTSRERLLCDPRRDLTELNGKLIDESARSRKRLERRERQQRSEHTTIRESSGMSRIFAQAFKEGIANQIFGQHPGHCLSIFAKSPTLCLNSRSLKCLEPRGL
jgi:hypothetical protein